MRERRKFARYDVSNYSRLKGGTQNAPIGERLMTMSVGGCGFWIPVDECNRSVGETVTLYLVFEGIQPDPVQFKAEILYVFPQPFAAQLGKFYGVKFQDEDQEEIIRIMELLDSEFQAGRLAMA